MVVSLAPGKIIVTGEYAGMFGEPVTITTVNLYTQVAVLERSDKLISITSSSFPSEEVLISFKELLDLWSEATKVYEQYIAIVDVSLLKPYRSTKLRPATLAVASALSSLQNFDFENGFNVKISSNLPIGSGLGSSASMCASVIGAVLTFYGKKPELEDINRMTYATEKILNGKPSGADNSAVVYGGWLRYQRLDNEMMIKKLDGLGNVDNWWLINGGVPSETSLELIGKVLDLAKNNPRRIKELIVKYRKVTNLVQKQIEIGYLKPDFLVDSQSVLEELGVIGENGKRIIKSIIKSGGYAKVSGAGGIKTGVGTILCYHDDEEKLKKVAIQSGFGYSPVILGGPGWQIEE